MLACVAPATAMAGLELISVGMGGVLADGDSFSYDVPSANGRYVVFYSYASNLVPGGAITRGNVFIRDRTAGTTRLVSLGQKGVKGNNTSFDGALSADGRIVAFASYAGNLVPPADKENRSDIFTRDLQKNTTERISVASSGVRANGASYKPQISADGRYVLFQSDATNLVPDDTNGSRDIFLRDRRASKTYRVSLGANFSQANDRSYTATMSQDAKIIAFESFASNLVSGDINNGPDIFVRNRDSKTTKMVNLTSVGGLANCCSFEPSITGAGRFIAFFSNASNLVPNDTNEATDVFVRDLTLNKTNRVSLGAGFSQVAGESYYASISEDGKRVVFASDAAIVSGDTNVETDIYIRDRTTQVTKLLSVGPDATPGNDFSFDPRISANGTTVVFYSGASNLTNGDTNGFVDVFVASP
jgi:Tol biopolymer transport system component